KWRSTPELKLFSLFLIQHSKDHLFYCRFNDVVATWPGSANDAGIFDNCGLKRHLELNDVGMLLGDSGYPLRHYLMTPVLRPQGIQQTAYNVAHARGRVVVERAFGLLKSRFRPACANARNSSETGRSRYGPAATCCTSTKPQRGASSEHSYKSILNC
ncbi:HARB1-like protein, partial [Mya arenaria]